MKTTARNPKLKYDNNVALGDILTIILGFFLLMVTLKKYALVQQRAATKSFSDFSTPNESKTASLSFSGMPSSGIVVDNSLDKNLNSTFLNKSVSISERQLKNITLKREILHLPQVFLQADRPITIEACIPTHGSAKEKTEAWEESARRARMMVTLLKSVGIAQDRIFIRTLGTHCQLIQSDSLLLNEDEKKVISIILD